MPVTKFPFLTIFFFFFFAKEGPFGSLIILGGCFKGTNDKSWEFWVEKEKERKTQIIKVAKSYHQVTWTQKNVTKERARVNL